MAASGHFADNAPARFGVRFAANSGPALATNFSDDDSGKSIAGPATISKIDATIVNVFNTIRPLQIYVRVVPNGDKVDLGGR